MVTPITLLAVASLLPNALACSWPSKDDVPMPVAIGVEPILRLNDQDEPFFRVGSAVMDREGIIWVVNRGSNRVLKFDPDGKLVQRFGGTGAGPGEFNQLGGSLVLAEGAILAGDLRGKVVRFESDRRAETFQFEGVARVDQFLPLGDEQWLVLGMSSGQGLPPIGQRSRGSGSLTIHARDGRLLVTLPPPPGLERVRIHRPDGRYSNLSPPFAKWTYVEVTGDGCILLGAGEHPWLEVLDNRGSTVTRIALPDAAAKPISPQEWNDVVSAMVDMASDPNERPRLRWVLEQIEYDPSPVTHGPLLVDDVGRIWVSRYRPVESDLPGWWVFSPSGEFLSAVGAPQGARRLLAARRGSAVLVSMDELGRESVTVHQLVHR